MEIRTHKEADSNCRKKVGIIIPTYNNERTIRQVVEGCRKSFAECRREDAPIVVVNDGSTDRTEQYARGMGVYIINHHRNCGKGKAIKSGIDFARKDAWDALITLDADLQHDPADIPAFLEAYDRYSDALILGCRSSSDMPFLSRLSRFVATTSFFAATRILLSDINTGFRLYPLGALDAMDLKCEYFTTEMEILLKATKLKVPIKEVKIKTIYFTGEENQRRYRVIVDTARFLPIFKHVLWRPKNGGVL